MAVAPRIVTAAEDGSLPDGLTGRRCSARQVQAELVTGGLGTETKRRANGQTRLYGIVDVAFVRLALRLHGDGISPWVARVVLTYLRNDLVRTWKSGAAIALTIRGLHGSLEPTVRTPPSGAAAYVPVRDVWRGLDAELYRVCAARSTVWMWRPVAAAAVPRTTA